MKRLNTKSRLWVSILALMMAALTIGGCGQKTDTDAGNPENGPERSVAEMDSFLVAFRPIMQAQMEGDYELIFDSLPDLLDATEQLALAQLPEFHNDVRDEYNDQILDLTAAINEFNMAVDEMDNDRIDSTLDDVRNEFITLMTILSAEIKPLDDFHEILQPLWHEATPNQDYAAIKDAVLELQKRADAIVAFTLPGKYSFLQDDFSQKAESLHVAVMELSRVCIADTLDEEIEDKMYEMHEAYHALTECVE